MSDELAEHRLVVYADPAAWIALPAAGQELNEAWLDSLADAISADAEDAASRDALADMVEAMRAGTEDGWAYWFAPEGRPTEAYVQVRLLTGLAEDFSPADVLRHAATTVAPQVDPLYSRGLGVTGHLIRVAVQDWSGSSLATWYGILPLGDGAAVLVTATSGSMPEMAMLAPHFSALVAGLMLADPTALELAAEEAA